MSRSDQITINLSTVHSADELHLLLSDALGLPGWYGRNWDAFWDAISGLVEMPYRLELSGWRDFEQRLPKDARMMHQCLVRLAGQYQGLAPAVEYS